MSKKNYWKSKRKPSQDANSGSIPRQDTKHLGKAEQQRITSFFFSSKSGTSESKEENNHAYAESCIPTKRQKCGEETENGVSSATSPTASISGNDCGISPITQQKIKLFALNKDDNCEEMACDTNSFTEEKKTITIENDSPSNKKLGSGEKCVTVKDAGEKRELAIVFGKKQKKNAVAEQVKYTPLELQVLELKNKYPNMMLMIQTGYKYTFYGEDAEVASRVLNIMAVQHQNLKTAVIPLGRLFVHIRKLVEEGYKVGVVNQTETAALKAQSDSKGSLFNRELSHIYTKATLIGDEVDPLTQEGEFSQVAGISRYIMTIAESMECTSSQTKGTTISFVAFEPSTGETIHDIFEDGPKREELEKRLGHLNPSEILVPKSISEATLKMLKVSSARLEMLEDKLYDFSDALIQVASFFSKREPESESANVQNMSDLPPLTVICFSVIIHHARQYGLEKALRVEGIRNFSSSSQYLQMNGSTLRNLDIFRTGIDTNRGSLIWALDHTKTKFGSRLLREWVSQPLRDITLLRKRQEAITELIYSDSAILGKLRDLLHGMPDVDRGLTTCVHQRSGPASLYAVLQALVKIHDVLNSMDEATISELESSLLKELLLETKHLLTSVHFFLRNINQQAAKNGDKTRLLNDYSAFPDVVQRLQEISAASAKLEGLKPEIARTLGVLKFEYTAVSGQEYLIEIKQAQKKIVPRSWRPVNETKQLVRMRTPEIDAYFQQLCVLREKLMADCEKAWLSFLEDFNANYYSYKKAIKNIATLDVLLSLAKVGKQEGYCRPTLLDSEETIINIEKGSHPVVSLLFSSEEQFVANDTKLSSKGERCMVISGPNMGGKSCYIRQVALIALMAHIGSYVPAKSATISILDAIYTRMGAKDEIFEGRSTLMLELEEASIILKKATQRSLVLMDELGRGTSSCDGTAIAMATLHCLVTKVQCLTLFVTHYPAVMKMEDEFFGSMHNYHMGFFVNKQGDNIEDGELTFLYEVTKGPASRSYGINVARLAGIPQHILYNASEKARKLEQWSKQKSDLRHSFKKLWNCSIEDLKFQLKKSCHIGEKYNENVEPEDINKPINEISM